MGDLLAFLVVYGRVTTAESLATGKSWEWKILVKTARAAMLDALGDTLRRHSNSCRS